MTNGWTAERRAAQAERARTNRPFTKSTGPKSSDGKAKVARNALKTGLHAQPFRDEIREIRAFLRFNRQTVAEYLGDERRLAARRREEERKSKNKLKAQAREGHQAEHEHTAEQELENKLKGRHNLDGEPTAPRSNAE